MARNQLGLGVLVVFLGVTFSGVPKATITKRSVLHFHQMIVCSTGDESRRYTNYGCYCGLGGAGTPVDDADRCCKEHDECYDRLMRTRECPLESYVDLFWTFYEHRGCSECVPAPEYGLLYTLFLTDIPVACRVGLCRCDSMAARCLARKPYNEEFVWHDKRQCIEK